MYGKKRKLCSSGVIRIHKLLWILKIPEKLPREARAATIKVDKVEPASSSPASRAQSASSKDSGDSRPQSPDAPSRASSARSRSRSGEKSSSPKSPKSDTKAKSESPDARPSRSRSPHPHPVVRSPDGRSLRSTSPDYHSAKSRSPNESPVLRAAETKSIDVSAKSKSPDVPSTRSPRDRSDSSSSSSDDDRQSSRHSKASLGSGNKINSRPSSPQAPRSPSSQSSRSSSPGSPPRESLRKRTPEIDNASVNSDSSSSSRKSVSSRGSRKTTSSRGSRRRKQNNDVSSDSSDSSVDSSSRKNKNIVKTADTQPEEISDGDIESDQEKTNKSNSVPKPEINISHEDLSDVSDLEDSIGSRSDNDLGAQPEEKTNDSQSKEERVASPDIKKVSEKPPRSEEGEEQLDFEAEDGECEAEITKEKDDNEEHLLQNEESKKTEEKEEEKKEELEEGEVTDEDDVRPEETEPRPVCRFFSRGQCTWGASCRFLHPGVTDKGNYTMFDLIRPVVPGEFRDERLYGKVEAPVVESAWERGLRTAKEMVRKSIKRKEQDIDFEEKKMNLSLAQEEFDKENGYYGRVTSPEPRYVRHVTAEYPVARPPPEEYYARRQVVYEPEFPAAPPPPRERIRSYRELPAHRMPDFFNNKYEEEPPPHPSTGKRSKPKREVIVQRAEERQGRGDEWQDPWMRSKSPAGRRKEPGRKRSYSSGSSYSSSSSSRSTTDTSRSSYRSRSRSMHRRRRSRSRRSRQVSPSVIVSERKAANERAALMNPPAPKRRAPSPGMMRVSGAANPPAPSREDQFGRTRSKLAVAAALARVKGRRSSKSSSGSSGSSSSDSDSSDSSSSSSRDGSPAVRRPAAVELVKAMDALKGGALEKKQIKLNLKNPVGVKKPEPAEFSRKVEAVQGKKRAANSPPPGDPKSKKATSRREELLKQLKAVEDAIAKKRSKV
ncbi:hypothetical protein JTB14_010117 [Gonioctena quinquepunctata]|nr:hypothetical protein JTB14_010117 [Gonioctena quinquepunctata]